MLWFIAYESEGKTLVVSYHTRYEMLAAAKKFKEDGCAILCVWSEPCSE